ncbi:MULTISPECIES: DUF6456 domain-containing protein [Halocynthiibacter]|uniref:DUF6456 domain-containing protein n=1 Tax=Halocynthiibacter halioticoli TaxID=2986804 RepID=A0AAE3IY52_9RHOB|nr:MULTISPECIES: DUF6456 domain-containing protein [Halocynthiibacter]MCV6824407.1 DUF6456 domain-containing protein [Halocynthiibacter halioticoli]MCW4057408.1 DUF6456 domain-containing protein [Halocynthiibacter sp. SDUM655004]
MGDVMDTCLHQDPLPHWVPQTAERYLLHTETGLSIRAVARAVGCHASTVMRQIHKFESRRDDLLVDLGLKRLGKSHFQPPEDIETAKKIVLPARPETPTEEDQELVQEARRILKRLCELGSRLLVGEEMEQAVVLRDLPSGQSTRTAILHRSVAEVMALNDWINCVKSGKVTLYEITPQGRAFLKCGGVSPMTTPVGFAESQAAFSPAPSSRAIEVNLRKTNLAETPLTMLSRRRDPDGNPLLTDEMIAAGERIREDFELAQLGYQCDDIWENYIYEGAYANDNPIIPFANSKHKEAHERARDALRELGQDLGDVVLRCVCKLEGLEAAEKEMGWCARSGKVILRIALSRLAAYYKHRYGEHGPLIG